MQFLGGGGRLGCCKAAEVLFQLKNLLSKLSLLSAGETLTRKDLWMVCWQPLSSNVTTGTPSPTSRLTSTLPLLLLSGKYFGSFERDSTCSREREKNQIICFFPSLLLPKLSWGRRQNCGSQKKMWNDLRLFSEISDDVEKKRWSFISLQLTQNFKKLRGSIFSLQSLKRMKKREKLITELCRKRIWQSIEEETREIL